MALVPYTAFAQQPTPEQVMQSRIATVSVNLSNLQSSLGAIADSYQQAVADNVGLRKKLAEVLEKCGEPCKDKDKEAPKP